MCELIRSIFCIRKRLAPLGQSRQSVSGGSSSALPVDRGVCRLALHPGPQMSSSHRRVAERSDAGPRCATLRNRARPQRQSEPSVLVSTSCTANSSRTFPSRRRSQYLEVGSGTSPLQQFLPDVVTSDVLDLPYLDLVFDCHDIDKLDAVKDGNLDVITLTNVLHHLKSPIAFLNRAANKLKSGGKVIATEPFFSALSTPIFKYLHHEPVEFHL